MVFSIAVQEKPVGLQKLIARSASTVGSTLGIVLAIATSSQATTPYSTLNNPGIQAQSEPLTEHTAREAAEAEADRLGLERLRARLLSPRKKPEMPTPSAHGTYLYGQQPIANQPETAYFVFESYGTNITGALYMPSSSFDCVRGQIADQRIALSVTDSYSQETYSYALTLNEPMIEVASQGRMVVAPPNIEGFYPLPLREQDRAILATCQAI